MSEKEAKVLKFIKKYKSKNDGLSPTIREICEATDISSTSVVHFYLHNLVSAGVIKIKGNKSSRGIIVVGGKWEMGKLQSS
jgi:repressor LexA